MVNPNILRSFNNLLPNCPDKDKMELLEHVDKKRIEKNGLDPKVVILRLTGAYIRHHYTSYDKIVGKDGKEKARIKIAEKVDNIMKRWRTREIDPMLAWNVYKNNFSGRVFTNEKYP